MQKRVGYAKFHKMNRSTITIYRYKNAVIRNGLLIYIGTKIATISNN